MSFAFNQHQGLVIVHAEIWGPSGSAVLSLALDTGATFTLVNQGRLMQLGYDPAVAPKRFQVSTANGVEFVPRLTVTKITALRQQRNDFSVEIRKRCVTTKEEDQSPMDDPYDYTTLIDTRKVALP